MMNLLKLRLPYWERNSTLVKASDYRTYGAYGNARSFDFRICNGCSREAISRQILLEGIRDNVPDALYTIITGCNPFVKFEEVEQ